MLVIFFTASGSVINFSSGSRVPVSIEDGLGAWSWRVDRVDWSSRGAPTAGAIMIVSAAAKRI